MGEVYRATDSVLERTVAVKLLSDRFASEPEARARFQREALAAARLSGRNVVTVFDVGEHRGRPLIVMEYLDGGSIFDRLVDGHVSREQALEWLEQTAAALDHAHAEGVVHRDVKPANLLLDGEGRVRVTDFGIASASGLDALTLPGMVLGTAGYLSPEQARGEPATPASDRYGFAVVAFELLTGRRPFSGDTPATEAYAHLHADVPRASSLDSSLPPSVDAVFERALAKDPALRPATCRELVADLRAAFDAAERVVAAPVDPAQVPTLVTAPATAPTTRVPRRRRRTNGAALALVAVVIGAAGIATVALLDSTRSAGGETGRESTTGRETTTQPPTTTAETPAPPAPSGADLNDEGFARMQAGDYAGALPLLRSAVLALRGSGSLTEAYASYNLAFTRFALGRCDGVIGLLDRSERIQGERDEIDQLRGEWESRCGEEAEGGSPPSGKGKGKGNGRGKGND